MLLSEEELPGQVGGFNVIGIRHGNHSLCPHIDHREVFEDFTPYSTCSDDEGLHFLNFLEVLLPHYNFQVPEILTFLNLQALQLRLFCWNGLGEFVQMECKELLDRAIFVCEGFDNLLGNNSSQICPNSR